MSLHSPACGHKQLCPCGTCDNSRQSSGQDLNTAPWKWVGGFGIRCGGCGFEGSATFWANLEKQIHNWGDNAILYPIKKDITAVTTKFLDKLKEDQYKGKHYEKNTDKKCRS